MAWEAFKSGAVSMPITINGTRSYKLVGEDLIDLFDFKESSNITKALNECPPIVYLPLKIASAMLRGEFSVVNANTLKPAQGDLKKYIQLLERPNYSQNKHQFLTQVAITAMNYGHCVILPMKPFKGIDGITMANQTTSMWALPAEYVEITWINKALYNSIYSQDHKENIKSIKFAGVEISKDDIILITDNNYYRNSVIIPESRLRTYETTIHNLIINLKARGKMMNSPMGILAQSGDDNINSIPLKKDEKERLQREFSSNYGFDDRQSKIMIANTKVDWLEMGYAIAQMQFNELEKSAILSLCEIYGYPPNLVGVFENSNVSERKEAKKELYNETVIPFAEHILQQLTEGLIIEDNVKFYVDYTKVPALQADKKEESEVRRNNVASISFQFKSGLITYGRAMELLNEEPRNEYEAMYFDELPTELQNVYKSKSNNNATRNTNTQTN